MAIRSLAEVGARLEEAVLSLPGSPASAQETFDRYEMLAIQILDSEFQNYGAQVLEEYLKTRLYLKQLELGLVPDFH